MSHIFTKVIQRIESFQEECAELIFGLETLLGENTSIADIAVNKSPEKKKKMDEAEYENSEDEVPETEPESPEEEPDESGKDEGGALRGKIQRTEKELEINPALRNWIIEYFEARKQGRFAEANVVKEKAMAIVNNKNLDKETVFYRADDIEKAIQDKEAEEDEEDNDSETSDKEE
jgi:hypothetical protein